MNPTTPAPAPPSAQSLWAGFRRASIAAAITALLGALLASLSPEIAPYVMYGAALGWGVYVLVVLLPGVIRLLRYRHRQARFD